MSSALVVGGGFAGLSAAVHLALGGAEVTLLEARPTLGGKAGEWAQGGFRFDTGPSVLTLPGVLTAIFERAGEPFPLELRALEPLCRYLYPSGRVWDVYRDPGRTTAQLSSREARAYLDLLDEARQLHEGSAPTFVYGPAPGPLDLLRYAATRGLRAHPALTLADLIDRHRPGPDLERFFLRFATYLGADPYRAPAVLHNVAWVELGQGVVYPVGGIHAVVRELAGLAKRLGVRILTGEPVERLEARGGRVRSVHAGGWEHRAQAVVSAVDVVRTERLLGRPSGRERLEPSLSGFVMLLGVAAETPRLAHHTVSFTADYPAEFAAIRRGHPPPDPTLYLAVSSRTEPERAPPGHENWFVMANAPALGRSFDWAADGRAYGERLLEVLARRGLGVEGRIRAARRLTPGDLSAFGHRGSIYGAAPHSLRRALRPGQRFPGIRNLFLAGGTVHPGGGVPLALLSGRGAAGLALGELRRKPAE